MPSHKAPNNTNNRSLDETLDLISPNILRQKARQLLDDVQKADWPSIFQPFKEHTEDVAKQVLLHLDRYDKTQQPVLKDLYLFLANICLNLFLFQHYLFKTAKRDATSNIWEALQHFTYYLSDKLQLRKKPLPVLGARYSSTGSPMYREYGLMLRPYYAIVADSLDNPIFWTLIAHELAHCKLSETDHVKRLLEAATRLDLDITHEMERKIEEALCDIIAARLLGPAFVYAYCTKLYPTFYGNGVPKQYPLDQFRLECMCSLLESAGFTETANHIRTMRDIKFTRNWTDEEISSLKEDLIKLSADFATISTDTTEKIVQTYITYWDEFIKKGAHETSELLQEISSKLIQMLKRLSSPLNPSTKLGC
jgi:hypothetical protein